MNISTLKTVIKDGLLISLSFNGKELIKASSPIFRLCLIEKNGNRHILRSDEAGIIRKNGNNTVFSGFAFDISVNIKIIEQIDKILVFADIKNGTCLAVERITLLPLNLLPLCGDGGDENTRLLLPYNEGLIVDCVKKIPDIPAQYPSSGGSFMFPNMMFAQTASYLFESDGIDFYLNTYTPDESRAPKEITVRDGELIFNIFTGSYFGESVSLTYPYVLRCGKGRWEQSCCEYRDWFSAHLPPDVRKVEENKDLPKWYNDNILVITYPVRGEHDMDNPEPNAMFPYINAYPLIDEIKNKTGMHPLVLLMHWEGTAPWAPPYVWPPYGGENALFEFRDKLHENGGLLGVYCSGFGYTKKSNLINEYDNTDKIDREDLYKYFCTSPEGDVKISRICTAQRSGYDICPACGGGRAILKEAYSPLFSSGIDYAQILDQNHGGGQYFCYSKYHGHAPAPGSWMTEKMQELLCDWNKSADNMLLGCESAAAEPFIGNLLFSDDRYELCYDVGRPVPMYTFLFHEYLHNFMGNQVCCYFPPSSDALCYRIAYSFAIGDAPTLTLTPDGKISPAWGTRDLSQLPDKEEVLSFLNTLNRARKSVISPYLNYGKMLPSAEVICGEAPFGDHLPALIVTTWEYKEKKITIIINPFDEEKEFIINGKKALIGGRDISVI